MICDLIWNLKGIPGCHWVVKEGMRSSRGQNRKQENGCQVYWGVWLADQFAPHPEQRHHKKGTVPKYLFSFGETLPRQYAASILTQGCPTSTLWSAWYPNLSARDLHTNTNSLIGITLPWTSQARQPIEKCQNRFQSRCPSKSNCFHWRRSSLGRSRCL